MKKPHEIKYLEKARLGLLTPKFYLSELQRIQKKRVNRLTEKNSDKQENLTVMSYTKDVLEKEEIEKNNFELSKLNRILELFTEIEKEISDLSL